MTFTSDQQSPVAAEEARQGLSRRAAQVVLAVFALFYMALVLTHLNEGYLDFGDGNYMYISWRLSEGAVLYRDILAPQPPMHLLTGTLLAKIGEVTHSPLLPFRLFSILLHLGTMVLVYLAAIRVTGGNDPVRCAQSRLAGLLAALLYLIQPIGFWWSLGYQSEPLEMFFFVWSFLLFLSWKQGKMLGAGITGALTPLTNMTAAPYVLFNMGYLAVRRRRLLLYYVLPVVTMIGLVVLVMELWTHAYLENVIFNQVGSFPRQEFLPPGQNLFTYVLGKLTNEGRDVRYLDGGYILLALIGLLCYIGRGPSDMREYVSFYSFFAFCSIIYVAKGGTMDYIFTIGEPFVAILGGYFCFGLWRNYLAPSWRELSWHNLSFVAGMMTTVMLVVYVSFPGFFHSWATLNQESSTYELDEYTTRQIVDQIKSHAPRRDDLILAPPYYAYLAHRRIAQDYSEIFLWTIKYYNEKQDKIHGRGIQSVERLAKQLEEKKIAFVVLDLDQTGRIPEIRSALEKNYQPLRSQELRTLNTRLQFYAPR